MSHLFVNAIYDRKEIDRIIFTLYVIMRFYFFVNFAKSRGELQI